KAEQHEIGETGRQPTHDASAGVAPEEADDDEMCRDPGERDGGEIAEPEGGGQAAGEVSTGHGAEKQERQCHGNRKVRQRRARVLFQNTGPAAEVTERDEREDKGERACEGFHCGPVYGTGCAAASASPRNLSGSVSTALIFGRAFPRQGALPCLPLSTTCRSGWPALFLPLKTD